MSYDRKKVFDVPGDVALDLLQVEDVQLKPQPWRVKVLDKLDSVLVVVHVVVGHAVGQGGITCGAIDEPRKSSKAIDDRVIINFRDKMS